MAVVVGPDSSEGLRPTGHRAEVPQQHPRPPNQQVGVGAGHPELPRVSTVWRRRRRGIGVADHPIREDERSVPDTLRLQTDESLGTASPDGAAVLTFLASATSVSSLGTASPDGAAVPSSRGTVLVAGVGLTRAVSHALRGGTSCAVEDREDAGANGI